MHEFVATAQAAQGRHGVRAMDVAKRMIDLGFHPSTVYFPLVVEEAMMVEPTETESKETLDGLRRAAMLQVARRGRRRPRPPARGARDHAGAAPGRGPGGPPPEAPLVSRAADRRSADGGPPASEPG